MNIKQAHITASASISNSNTKNIHKIKFIILICFVLTSLLLAVFTSLIFSKSSLHTFLFNSKATSPLFFIFLTILAGVSNFPLTFIAIPGSIIFSPIALIIYLMIGSFGGGIFVFFLARFLGREQVKAYVNLTQKSNTRAHAINNLINQDALHVALLLNLFYFFPKPLANSIAGVSNLSFIKFLLPLISNLPNTIGLVMILHGFVISKASYSVAGIFIILISSLLPIYLYKSHLKDLIQLSLPESVAGFFSGSKSHAIPK